MPVTLHLGGPASGSMDEYRIQWIARAQTLGHVLYRVGDDTWYDPEDPDSSPLAVDWWYLNVENHNGPGCKACKTNWCEHCTGPAGIKPCTGAT